MKLEIGVTRYVNQDGFFFDGEKQMDITKQVILNGSFGPLVFWPMGLKSAVRKGKERSRAWLIVPWKRY